MAEHAKSEVATRAVDELDFWSYVDLAVARLAEFQPAADVRSTRLLLVLNRASQAVIQDLESQAQRPSGLNWSSFKVLHCLWLTGGLEAKQVAALTGLSRALVSSTIKPMIAAGLLNRDKSAQDGRAVRLSATEAGEQLISQVFLEQNVLERGWAERLTEAERGILMMLLEKLAGNPLRTPGGRASPTADPASGSGNRGQ
ncbi:MAG: MarR family transcriptional regulator [Renibacterium sp.]|nr:MarR family transcriptional regulator [Renibacterium sp.]